MPRRWAPVLLAVAVCLALAGAGVASAAAVANAPSAAAAHHHRVALALSWPPPASPFQAADEIVQSVHMGLELVLALAGGKLDADDDWPRVVASVATGCAVSLGAVAATGGGLEPLAAAQARALTAVAVSRALGTVRRGARHLIA